MKKTTKNNLLAFACVMSLATLCGGLALQNKIDGSALQNESAGAQESPLSTASNLTLQSPELRIKTGADDATGNGLRFVVQAPSIPETVTETGTIVILTSQLEGELLKNTTKSYVFDTTDAWNVCADQDENYVQSYAYFYNIPPIAYNWEYTYRAYWINDGQTEYSEVGTACLADVALDVSRSESATEIEKEVANDFLIDYTVTFKENDSDEDPFETKTAKYGSTLSSMPEAPEKEGYKFDGWKVGETTFDENTVVKGNVTATAQFKINTYSVTFQDVDGSTTRFETATADYNTKISAPDFIALEPYKANELVWQTTDGKDFDFKTAITSDITLVAKRCLQNVIDFSTMKRIPTELMSSKNGFEYATDEATDSQVLKVKGLYSGDSGFVFNFGNTEDMFGAKVKVTFKQLSYVTQSGINMHLNSIYENWFSATTLQNYTTVEAHITADGNFGNTLQTLKLNSDNPNGGNELYVTKIEWYAPEDLSTFDFYTVDFTQMSTIPTGLVTNAPVNLQSDTTNIVCSYDSDKQAVKAFGRQIDKGKSKSGFEVLYTQMANRTLPKGTKIIVEAQTNGFGLNVFVNNDYVAWIGQDDSKWQSKTYELTSETELMSIGIAPGTNNWTSFWIKSVKIVLPEA